MATDPRGLRGDAPLLDAWLRFQEREMRPFTIPGHKHRTDLVGDVVSGDVPLFGGLDSMSLASGVLAEAERRAAVLWRADVARFSVGGSTHGNQALALAVAGPGARVVVGRTLHRSMLLGLVLAGLIPVWVRPRVDPHLGLPLGVAPGDVAAALEQCPDAAAVFVGDPSYVGTVGDVAGMARVAHRHGIPLIVDAAWAAHFGFHPHLPPHPLAAGADAMVVSAHKTLPAWSQGALVLARTRRIDAARLDAAVEATHTTSPSGAILASIDASRALLARDGRSLLEQTVSAVRGLRERLAEVDGLAVLDGPGVDPVKVTLVLSGTGADGRVVEAGLIERGMPVEMADRDTLVAMVTLADDAESVGALGDALVHLVEAHSGSPRPVTPAGVWEVDPVVDCPPREAFFAARDRVRLGRALGRTSAELIAPYPPGVPVLAPGERVTDAVLDALRRARESGARIAYAHDPDLATIDVLAS